MRVLTCQKYFGHGFHKKAKGALANFIDLPNEQILLTARPKVVVTFSGLLKQTLALFAYLSSYLRRFVSHQDEDTNSLVLLLLHTTH